MGYSQDRRSRWHNLRQQREESVQEYTTEFRRLAVMLGISITYEDVFTKYVAGLQRQIQNELRMYSFEDISSARRIAMAIEVNNKNGGLKIEEDVKEHIVERDNKKKVILGQVEELDKSLTLMMKPTSKVTKEKEELFTLKIQVKQEVIEAIIDTRSEKNLISYSLVERLGLETTPHPRPYSLGWIKKDIDTQVNRQCKFRFAITNQFIDEVTCEVVPLDICQVIFGNPYLWE
ncbi:hypothetical protein Tco_0973546 [Tanacetum coccineum]